MLLSVWYLKLRIWPMFKRLLILLSALSFVGGSVSAAEWSEEKSDHFIVYYKSAPERFVQSVIERAEEVYEKTTTVLGFTRYKGWTWDGRAKIYIYDDAEDYKNSSGYDWSAGVVTTQTRTISTYPSANGFFDSLLPHELGHIIFRDFVGSGADVPLWLEEGIAMAQEEGRRWGSDDRVRRAMEAGSFISVPDLSSLSLTNSSPRELVDLFYDEAASLVNFLLEDGEMYRFSRLCDGLKDGKRFEQALKKAYMKYPTLGDLDEAWRSALQR